jgi:hypothetical protein
VNRALIISLTVVAVSAIFAVATWTTLAMVDACDCLASGEAAVVVTLAELVPGGN